MVLTDWAVSRPSSRNVSLFFSILFDPRWATAIKARVRRATRLAQLMKSLARSVRSDNKRRTERMLPHVWSTAFNSQTSSLITVTVRENLRLSTTEDTCGYPQMRWQSRLSVRTRERHAEYGLVGGPEGGFSCFLASK